MMQAAEPESSTATPSDPGISQREGATPVPQDHLQAEGKRLATRQAALDKHRQSVVAGIAKLTVELESIPDAEVNKRLGIRQKLKLFQDQLSPIAEEQGSVDEQKALLAQQEQKAQVDLHLTARRNAQHEGVKEAAGIREALAVVAQRYHRWREWEATDRRLKDALRSLAPDQTGAVPDLAYTSGMDQTFQQALGGVLSEASRMQRRLQERLDITSQVVAGDQP